MRWRLLTLILLMSGCPATDDQIRQTLTFAGYRDIQDDGVAILGCGKNEIGSRFTATNPVGHRVSGLVCCGGYTPLNKGCTIRSAVQ